MNKVWVVIPTYWGKNGTKENPSDTGTFDHPTELDGIQTLERTIENITQFEDSFNILVLLAVTHKKYKSLAKARVEAILSKYKTQKDIYLICNDDIDEFNTKFNGSPLNLKTYGSIRNVQLAIPYFMGADYIIAIDDDEIISDKNYFKKVSELMNNKDIDILSGVYKNDKGSFLLPEVDSKDLNPYVQKFNLINSVITNAMNNSLQPHKTYVGFGGNMIFSRKVIKSVCFDEYIPRGEDFDYILNALDANYSAYFDKSIPIVHLPIIHNDREGGLKILNDIKRHIYTYYKKQSLNMNVNQDIYPGEFLKSIEKLKQYSITAYKEVSNMTLAESTFEVNKIIEDVIKNKDTYSNQKEKWNLFLSRVDNNKELYSFVEKWIETLRID
jgi:hypothetical protein